MPASQWILLNVPAPLLGAAVVVLAILSALVGSILTRRIASHEKLRLHNDDAGNVFGTIGQIYAVLLAFTVVLVWQDYTAAGEKAQKEASVLGSIYRDAVALRQPASDQFRQLLREYGQQIVLDEWPAMARGGEGARAQKAQENIWAMTTAFEPQSRREEIFFNQAVERFNQICELRRERLNASRQSISGIVWFVLLVGGFITSYFPFLFGVEDRRMQILIVSGLTVTIGLILFTIFEFQYPYTGTLSVRPDALRELHMLKGLV